MKKVITILMLAGILALLPTLKTESINVTHTTTTNYENNIRVSTHGACSVPLEEGVYREPEEPVDLDNYYIAWADGMKLPVDDFKLICYTVFCESGNQPLEAQVKVARVILFRMLDSRFPDTAAEVIYQGGGTQFNVVRWNGFPYAYPYTDTTEIAVFTAITESPEDPYDMLLFRSGHYFSNYKS